MELLRLLAMLGILVVHSDFFALGAPTQEECARNPYLSCWRIGIESISVISVNLFVLLSGWYGIRPKKMRLLEFLFQILFFNVLFFIVFSFIIPDRTFTRDGIGSLFMLDKRFWFVKAYLLLYILSPVLNDFCQNAKQRQYLFILTGFFLFQMVYGWLFPSVSWFKMGYSTISFIGIYLLAAYLRRYYTGGGNNEKALLLFVYIAFIIVNTALIFCSVYYFNGAYNQRLIAYNSPLVMTASVAVFLLFTKVSFKSIWVNYVAVSSFAAFLFHGNHFFVDEVYVAYIKKIFDGDTFAIISLKTLFIILIIFTVAICVDKIRIWIWERISSKMVF